ncbi:MAG: 3-oxoacyl-ACP synthase [Halobacteriales archaeon]
MTDTDDGRDAASTDGPRSVAVTGLGRYVPDEVLAGETVAERSGIPEAVVVEKMGLREKRVCPPDEDHCSDMAVTAARRALADAGYALGPDATADPLGDAAVDADAERDDAGARDAERDGAGGDSDPARDAGDLDLVLYHGSEYKDYVVWSAAADVADRVGAAGAFATESYTLCAGAPIALRQVRSQLLAGDVDRALLVSASREEDLVDYGTEDASFMFNFGSGASAMVLEAAPDADRTRARVLESGAVTDGDFSRDVIMPAGGSVAPPTRDTVEKGLHALDVPNHESMKERLGEVTLDNFLSVADEALAGSGYDREDVDFVALTHMKRSFHEHLVEALGDPADYYLDEYGHVQSVDQVLAVDEALDRGLLESGDVVLFLAAGTGYTWAATVLEWVG